MKNLILTLIAILPVLTYGQTAAQYTERAGNEIVTRDYNKAIADCNAALARDNNFGMAYFYRAIAKSKFPERYDEAMADFNKAESLGLNNGNYYFERGKAKITGKDFEGAIADLDKAIALNPLPDYFYQRARAKSYPSKTYPYLVDYAAADADFNSATAANPAGFDYVKEAENKKKEGDVAGAMLYLSKVAVTKATAIAWDSLAMQRIKLYDFTGAIANLDKAITLDANFAQAYYDRGFAKSQNYDEIAGQSDFIGAHTDYDMAISIDPMVDVKYERGYAGAYKYDYNKVIVSCSKLIASNRTSSIAYYHRATAKYRLGMYEAAIKDFDKAIEYGASFDKYFNRGLANEKANRDKEAIADYTKAITMSLAIKKPFPVAYLRRGLVKKKLAVATNGKKVLPDKAHKTIDDGCSDLNEAANLGHPDAKNAYLKMCNPS
ncbi:MAG TPA: hypothetical protein VK528_06770 [Flavobacterium sp.]|nr:hypothetical protein [Flavobacterium sp.]